MNGGCPTIGWTNVCPAGAMAVKPKVVIDDGGEVASEAAVDCCGVPVVTPGADWT